MYTVVSLLACTISSLPLSASPHHFPQVVELLLEKGANYEHRNVSDYTPLSLAASGGYVNVIKLLLKYKADINSREMVRRGREGERRNSTGE